MYLKISKWKFYIYLKVHILKIHIKENSLYSYLYKAWYDFLKSSLKQNHIKVRYILLTIEGNVCPSKKTPEYKLFGAYISNVEVLASWC